MIKGIHIQDLSWGQSISLPTSRPLSQTPHFVGGRYPCRSIAYIPRIIINSYIGSERDLVVLDPFMGSGTTAIEACFQGASVFGIEIDPYARLIASVSTRRYGKQECKALEETIRSISERGPGQTPARDMRPNLANLAYWFDDVNFKQLWQLKTAINELANNEKEREFLLVMFGDIIRACSKAERQSLKPYISKKYPKNPKSVFDEFSQTAQKYLKAIESNHQLGCTGIQWVGEDATAFDLQRQVHLAISSPPYINAMDYTRCIKLESAWIGTADDQVIKAIRDGQLGETARSKNLQPSSLVEEICNAHFSPLKQQDRQKFSVVLAFFNDMLGNLRSVHKSLKPGGFYFLIVGNSVIRGNKVETHEILAQIAQEVGFEWKYYFHYPIKDHRTSIPRGDKGGKIQMEHVIGLCAK